jgi:hypothetical protein
MIFSSMASGKEGDVKVTVRVGRGERGGQEMSLWDSEMLDGTYTRNNRGVGGGEWEWRWRWFGGLTAGGEGTKPTQRMYETKKRQPT